MSKCNELEVALSENVLVKEMRHANKQMMFDKWKMRVKMYKMLQLQKSGDAGNNERIRKLCADVLKPKRGDISIMHENTNKMRKNDEKYESIYLENQDIRINANSYINKFNYSQVIISQINAKLL